MDAGAPEDRCAEDGGAADGKGRAVARGAYASPAAPSGAEEALWRVRGALGHLDAEGERVWARAREAAREADAAGREPVLRAGPESGGPRSPRGGPEGAGSR